MLKQVGVKDFGHMDAPENDGSQAQGARITDGNANRPATYFQRLIGQSR